MKNFLKLKRYLLSLKGKEGSINIKIVIFLRFMPSSRVCR